MKMEMNETKYNKFMKKKWLAIIVTIFCVFVACSDDGDDILDNTSENQYIIDDNSLDLNQKIEKIAASIRRYVQISA
mgnify:CR=1 FL=1